MPLHVSSTCTLHQEVKIALHSLSYHHTYRCYDTRGCVMQFWPPDEEHMCSKHVEAWNKLIAKQKFYASSWLITEVNCIRVCVCVCVCVCSCLWHTQWSQTVWVTCICICILEVQYVVSTRGLSSKFSFFILRLFNIAEPWTLSLPKFRPKSLTFRPVWQH